MGKSKTTKRNPTVAEFKPHFKSRCEACGHTPVVSIYVDGKLIKITTLCGACTWGDSSCLDPANW